MKVDEIVSVMMEGNNYAKYSPRYTRPIPEILDKIACLIVDEHGSVYFIKNKKVIDEFRGEFIHLPDDRNLSQDQLISFIEQHSADVQFEDDTDYSKFTNEHLPDVPYIVKGVLYPYGLYKAFKISYNETEFTTDKQIASSQRDPKEVQEWTRSFNHDWKRFMDFMGNEHCFVYSWYPKPNGKKWLICTKKATN